LLQPDFRFCCIGHFRLQLCDTFIIFVMLSFNPRTHVGCDAIHVPSAHAMTCFNPRTHVGCDIPGNLVIGNGICFNPRTHVGCDFGGPFRRFYTARFQSTHPRGVRRYPCSECPRHDVFQSTHPRGVRLKKRGTTKSSSRFNPRTHVGCDSKSVERRNHRRVSIHAPTWGATHKFCNAFVEILCFNPRTHVGCDSTPLVFANSVIKFQSTHPRGVRRRSGKNCRRERCFNPRTHVGCDPGWNPTGLLL